MTPDKSPFLPKSPQILRTADSNAGLRERVAVYLDNRFEVSRRESSIWTEVKAGSISWMTMSYIMVVNPTILVNAATAANPISMAPLMSATAMSSVVGCLLCGLWSNMPLGLMPGMGLNAYFVYGICHTFDVSLQQAFSCAFASGALLLVLSQAGVCHWLVKTVLSQHLKNAITVSIGMFQAMIGFQIMGLVVASPDTLVTLGDVSFSNTKLYISMFGFVLVAIMSCQQVHGALLIGICQIAICSWILGISPPPTGVFLMPTFDLAMAIDFSGWNPDSGKLNGMLVGTAVLFFVALFDLAGVQYGLTSLAGLLKDGSVPRSTEIFSSAAISTMFGALLGTSPLIIANESSAGIMEGARTGLSTIVCGLLFLLSAFISPLLASVPHLATAAPLVLIGAFMMGPIGGIDWDKLDIALPSFVTCTVVPFTYSIHVGIMAGIAMDLILSFITWCREGCIRKRKDSANLQTPDRFPSPVLGGTPEVVPARSRGNSVNSGRNTPLNSRKFQSPHAHSMIQNLAADGKDTKVEKLLDDLRLAVSSQNAPLEPRDEMLLRALEEYLQISETISH